MIFSYKRNWSLSSNRTLTEKKYFLGLTLDYSFEQTLCKNIKEMFQNYRHLKQTKMITV